jgi:SEC-C motif-containing protein
MTMRKRQPVRLVLDGGGPIDIWKEAAPVSLRRRLLITTSICDNPECDCRDVWVEGIVVDERYKKIEYGSHTLSYSFKPAEGEPPESPALRRLSAAVNIDSGEARFSTTAPAERHDEEMLGWLKAGLDEYHLERLRKRWRLAKGVDQDRWRRRDWSWWQPGDMISWGEVFPDEFNITLVQKDDVYWVDDMYCINPECTCNEAGLYFARITTGDIEDLGAISVTFPSGRFSDFMSEQGNGRVLNHLWNELRKRSGILTLLNERMRRIKPIGQEIAHLSMGGKEAAHAPSQRIVGRNDPCPCGSGKKFKRCCDR